MHSNLLVNTFSVHVHFQIFGINSTHAYCIIHTSTALMSYFSLLFQFKQTVATIPLSIILPCIVNLYILLKYIINNYMYLWEWTVHSTYQSVIITTSCTSAGNGMRSENSILNQRLEGSTTVTYAALPVLWRCPSTTCFKLWWCHPLVLILSVTEHREKKDNFQQFLEPNISLNHCYNPLAHLSSH